ncbi:MAG: SpoIIIAH-like family protein [Eubacteriales bacterium]|nr:SpoIIIAH-like family protein [Eubacteriales bacterium]
MKKTTMVLLGTGALLLTAILVNTAKNNKVEAPTPEPTMQIEAQAASLEQEADYFAVFRQDRENVREQEVQYLETIIQEERTDAETLRDAQERKIALVELMEQEFNVETLLRAKGFSDAAITIHNGTVNVVLKTGELTDKTVAQVLDVVCRETGAEAENVKITGTK